MQPLSCKTAQASDRQFFEQQEGFQNIQGLFICTFTSKIILMFKNMPKKTFKSLSEVLRLKEKGP